MERMWINQPSNRDTLHHLHGVNVLATSGRGFVKIYFLSGAIISMRISSLWLSKGWR